MTRQIVGTAPRQVAGNRAVQQNVAFRTGRGFIHDDTEPDEERFEEEASRGFDAADELDDDVGLRDDAVRVVGQEAAVDRRVPRRLQVPYGYCDDLEPGARSRGQVLRLLFEQASHLSAHGPAPEQADPHVFHAFSFRWE